MKVKLAESEEGKLWAFLGDFYNRTEKHSVFGPCVITNRPRFARFSNFCPGDSN